MDKIKPLLLPLALVFGAIASFQAGGQYGASNLRAHAVSENLQFLVPVYENGAAFLNPEDLEVLATRIDQNIALGAQLRDVWYLDKIAEARLNATLANALQVRGNQVIERFATAGAEGTLTQNLTEIQALEIRGAVQAAQAELVEPVASPAETSGEEAETSL